MFAWTYSTNIYTRLAHQTNSTSNRLTIRSSTRRRAFLNLLEPARVPGNCARCMSSLVRSVFLGFLLILLTVRALRSRPLPATQPRMPHLLCHPSVYLTPYPPNFDPLTSILILTRLHLFDVIILTFPTILVRVTLYLFFSTMLLKALKSVCYLSSIRTTIDVIHPLFHSCLHQRKVQ